MIAYITLALVSNSLLCADGEVDSAYGDVGGEYGSSDGDSSTASVGIITAGGTSLIHATMSFR